MALGRPDLRPLWTLMFSEETVTVRHPFPAAYHPRPVTIPLTPRGGPSLCRWL
jgi:hypothetical protein